jgi:ankyrin repeat protein
LRNNEKNTPLHLAVKEGHFDMVELLIDKIPELKNQRTLHGADWRTPLHHAAAIGHMDLIELLVTKIPVLIESYMIQDLEGWGPSHYATNSEIKKYLQQFEIIK